MLCYVNKYHVLHCVTIYTLSIHVIIRARVRAKLYILSLVLSLPGLRFSGIGSRLIMMNVAVTLTGLHSFILNASASAPPPLSL